MVLDPEGLIMRIRVHSTDKYLKMFTTLTVNVCPKGAEVYYSGGRLVCEDDSEKTRQYLTRQGDRAVIVSRYRLLKTFDQI